MTPEAIALHYLDNLDAKVHAFSREIRDDPSRESSWTPFHPEPRAAGSSRGARTSEGGPANGLDALHASAKTHPRVTGSHLRERVTHGATYASQVLKLVAEPDYRADDAQGDGHAVRGQPRTITPTFRDRSRA